MKIKVDNSIHIRDKNKIKNSVIGNNSVLNADTTVPKEPWYSKLFWKLLIPIAVVLIATAISLWVGLK